MSSQQTTDSFQNPPPAATRGSKRALLQDVTNTCQAQPHTFSLQAREAMDSQKSPCAARGNPEKGHKHRKGVSACASDVK